jgi:hypothetical protein
MVREFEEYANSTMEQLRAMGIDTKIRSAEINPNLYKLCIELKTTETLASFTAWEKEPALSVEVDIEVFGVLDDQFEVSRTLQPKELQELIKALDELTKHLTLQHHN